MIVFTTHNSLIMLSATRQLLTIITTFFLPIHVSTESTFVSNNYNYMDCSITINIIQVAFRASKILQHILLLFIIDIIISYYLAAYYKSSSNIENVIIKNLQSIYPIIHWALSKPAKLAGQTLHFLHKIIYLFSINY